MPPQYGLYGAMLPAIVAALWGSSWHLVSGPTNATSLWFSRRSAPLAAPFSADYVTLVLTLTLMVGADAARRWGLRGSAALVNFISHTRRHRLHRRRRPADHRRAAAQLLRHRRSRRQRVSSTTLAQLRARTSASIDPCRSLAVGMVTLVAAIAGGACCRACPT